MKTWNSMKISGVVAISFLLAFNASAIIALNYPNNLSGNQGGTVDRALGFVFNVNSPIAVNQLGAFDDPGNGSGTFGGTVSVAIYKVTLGSGNSITAGTLIGSPVDFSTGSAGTLLAGTDTRVKNITAETLGTGTYMLVANHYGTVAGTETPYNLSYAGGGGGAPAYPSVNTGGGLITWNGTDYYMNSPASWGSSMPTPTAWTIPASVGYPRWTAGNFNFTPVPEAAQFATAGVGLLGLVYIGRYARMRRTMKAA
jgi:hypothetical protein